MSLNVSQSRGTFKSWRTGLLLLIGAVSIGLALLPGGSDAARKFWTHIILLPGGLLAWGAALHRPARLSNRDWIWLMGGTLAGVFMGLTIVRNFAGGDYWHTWRGFPCRWLTGSSYDGTLWHWSLYPPGLMIDSLYWFDLSIAVVFFYRQVKLLGRKLKFQH